MTSAFVPVPLDPGRVDEAAAVLGRAFMVDPPMVYIFPDAGERARRLPAFFATMLRLGLGAGEVWATPGAVRGVAIWLPPGSPAATEQDLVAAGFGEVAASWGEAAFGRLSEILLALEARHLDLLAGPHWYLNFLGVEPEAQGKGIGAALVRPALARAGAAGLPCYLDTMLARNVAIYERLGFAVIDEAPLVGDRMWVWTMGFGVAMRGAESIRR